MLVPNDNNFPKRPNGGPAGWAIAGTVVVLMASLVYFTNGRSSHAMPHEQRAAVHFHLH